MIILEIDEAIDLEGELEEARIKKIVNRRGQITKRKTAGRKGRTIKNGKVSLVSGNERRSKRLGNIKRKRTLRKKSSAKKRRSALFGAKGRAKRKAMHVTDTRKA